MSAPHILVIGGGPAGTFAAIAAKKQNPDAVVTLLTDEGCEPYEKPPLSKAFLLGKMTPAEAQIAGPAGIASHGVALTCDARVTSVDRKRRELVLGDGRRLAYDALVLATGASARELPHLPRGMRGVHYLRTEADAHRLKAELGPATRLVVVGGGLIGLEVAASAAELGAHPIVLEIEPRILARVCDEATGARVHDAHRRRGVDIRTGTGLRSAAAQEDGSISIETSDGGRIVADVVIVGIGSRPDAALATEAGLAVDDGIVVDAQCRTSDPHIFAAGDCTKFPGPHGAVRLENWRHAQDQGMVAGRNAAGGADAYGAVPSFWSEQYDLYIQGVGWPVAGSERVERPLPGNAAIVFDVHDGRLVYAMGINAQKDISMARRLIERKVPIDMGELADPSKPLQAMLKRAQS